MSPPSYPGKSPSPILIIALCRFGEAIAIGMLIPVLPIFLNTLQSPYFQEVVNSLTTQLPLLENVFRGLSEGTAEARTAILFCLSGLAMAFIQIASGRISDWLDMRKALILTGMGLAALGSLYLTVLTQFWQLLVTRILQGVALGLTFPPMMAIIARHSPPGGGGRLLGLYSTIRLIGFGLGPIIGGLVADFGGYQATFMTSAGLLAISVIAVALFVDDPPERGGKKKERGPLPPIQPMFRILGAGIFIMMVGISAVISLFPWYQQEFGATEAQLGFVFSAFIITRGVFQYPLGWLGDRYDKKKVMVAGLLAFIPLVTLQGQISSLSELLILRMGLGVVVAAIGISVSGISAERSVPGNRARVMGINTFSFGLGVAIGPLLTGLVDNHSIAFAIPGGLALAIVLLVLAVVPSDASSKRDGNSAI